MALTSKLTAIADAISAKTGETGKMTLEQMPGKIGAISGVGGGGFDTSQMTACDYMFMESGSETIDLAGLDTRNVRSVAAMFYNCDNLKSIDLSVLDFSNVETATQMFYGCPRLETIDLGNLCGHGRLTEALDFISFCKSLSVIKIGDDLEEDPQDCIFEMTDSQNDYPQDFQIQVPARLVNAYKSDARWRNYREQIVPRP